MGNAGAEGIGAEFVVFYGDGAVLNIQAMLEAFTWPSHHAAIVAHDDILRRSIRNRRLVVLPLPLQFIEVAGVLVLHFSLQLDLLLM